ncbi:hypothetical protein BDB00DRAFT_853457 [Zychaea mexicana]|uniref:uncharacterized protein n=1 Tax=Zychaea mexicana TaxID=64656 RepID=UPI0022FE07C0|nr:uncharacterized protein BDB00DRAFT_853457 [Zychaea mexicana]KAI9484775.1 hypothetical protein BDB00DRAFT_853457 [Zychaea mexicana]
MAEMLRPFVVKFVARVLLLLLICYYKGKHNKKVVESIHSRNKESTETKTIVDVINTEIKSLILGS